jgi:hypothetical protein
MGHYPKARSNSSCRLLEPLLHRNRPATLTLLLLTKRGKSAPEWLGTVGVDFGPHLRTALMGQVWVAFEPRLVLSRLRALLKKVHQVLVPQSQRL